MSAPANPYVVCGVPITCCAKNPPPTTLTATLMALDPMNQCHCVDSTSFQLAFNGERWTTPSPEPIGCESEEISLELFCPFGEGFVVCDKMLLDYDIQPCGQSGRIPPGTCSCDPLSLEFVIHTGSCCPPGGGGSFFIEITK